MARSEDVQPDVATSDTTLAKLEAWYPHRDSATWVLGIALGHHHSISAGTFLLFNASRPDDLSWQLSGTSLPRLPDASCLTRVAKSGQACCSKVALPGDDELLPHPVRRDLALFPLGAFNFYRQLKQLYFYLMKDRSAVYTTSIPNGVDADSALVLPAEAPHPFVTHPGKAAEFVQQGHRQWLVRHIHAGESQSPSHAVKIASGQ